MKNPAVPKAFGTRYLIVRSYYFHIRSLSPTGGQGAQKIGKLLLYYLLLSKDISYRNIGIILCYVVLNLGLVICHRLLDIG